MILLLAWVAIAAAAPVWVAPGDMASSVIVLVDAADGVRAAACADGAAPDRGPADGRWACGDLRARSGDRVGLLLEGGLTDAGTWSGGEALVVDASGARTVLAGRTDALPAAAPSATGRREPRGAVVVRVEGVPSGAAPPLVRLMGGARAVELGCGDDGTFPDTVVNDGSLGCVGVFDGSDADVRLDAREVGHATWSDHGALRFLRVDATTGRVDTAPFALRVGPGPTADAPSAADAPAPSNPGPDAPPPGPDGPRPSPSPEPSLRPDAPPDASGGRWPAIAVGLVLGAAGAAWLARPPRGLPPGVELLPSAPLFDGGPVAGGPPAGIRAEAPQRVAAQLLPLLARTHRVLFVAPTETQVTPVLAHPVYRIAETDRIAVEDAARALARRPGAPLAVLVVGAGTVTDRGGVAGAPLALLSDGIGDRAWLVVVAEPDADLPMPTLPFRQPA